MSDKVDYGSLKGAEFHLFYSEEHARRTERFPREEIRELFPIKESPIKEFPKKFIIKEEDIDFGKYAGLFKDLLDPKGTPLILPLKKEPEPIRMDFRICRTTSAPRYVLRNGTVVEISIVYETDKTVEQIHEEYPITKKMEYLGIGKCLPVQRPWTVQEILEREG